MSARRNDERLQGHGPLEKALFGIAAYGLLLMQMTLSLTGGTRRLQQEQAAAKIVGVELGTFRHLVACGHFPKPLPLIELYDMKAIDAALDRMSGLTSPTNVLDAWRDKRHAR